MTGILEIADPSRSEGVATDSICQTFGLKTLTDEDVGVNIRLGQFLEELIDARQRSEVFEVGDVRDHDFDQLIR